jgi:hypothetical protein
VDDLLELLRLKFELLKYGNDFKIWEKLNLTGSCQDV